MIEPVESLSDIREETAKLLRRADAYGRLPTPVQDIVEAAGLSRAKHNLLSGDLTKVPQRFASALRRVRGKVRGILDRREREVHIEPEHDGTARGNFATLHEVGHQIIPWQSDLVHADDQYTLSPDAREMFEFEANAAAADLLFQGKGFTQYVAQSRVGLAAMIDGGKVYGASLRSSLRRYAESHRSKVVGVVLDPTNDGMFSRREMVASQSFRSTFPTFSLPFDFAAQQSSLGRAAAEAHLRRGEIVEFEIQITDARARTINVRGECLFTTYNVLCLLWIREDERFRRTVRLSA